MNRLTLEERKRANKIRCKLLYTIDRDIRETKKTNKNKILINSMTLKEIEDKFLLFPNYKMKLSTTFTKIANKYMVIQSYDKNLNTKFYYTDYLQDQKKVNHCIVKFERKRISANNIIKIPLLVETHEVQSPIHEIFANKMNIGDKKLIKPKEIVNNILNSMNNNKKYGLNEIEYKNNDEIIKKKIDNITNKEKSKSKKINIKIKEDDSSLSSLTLELIQKKANFLSASLNHKNKKEIKRRRKQLEAIKKLRQFCFENLRNKKRCITKSSHQNLLYINNKFDDENEKNNSNYSSKNNIKNKNKNNNIKNNNRNNIKNNKNNSKKKYDSLFESKHKKTPRKNKEKKKLENSTARKVHKNDSSKKSPIKLKRVTHERKSLVLKTNIISGKLDMDILRFKKRKKEKNNSSIEEDLPRKSSYYNLYINNNTNWKFKKKKTGILLRESFKDRPKLFNNNKNNILISVRGKNKNNNVIFNEQNTTKRNSSSNNFFNRKYRTNKFNTISSRNLFKPITKFRIGKTSGSKSERRSRHSSPGKPDKNSYYGKKESKSEKSLNVEKLKDIKRNDKYIHKEKIVFQSIKQRNSQNWNKNKNEMQKVVEEDD